MGVMIKRKKLSKVVVRATLTYFKLLTVLSNIQKAINIRPLTYLSNSDPLLPITPNSLLKLHSDTSLVLREVDHLWVDKGGGNRLELTLTRL